MIDGTDRRDEMSHKNWAEAVQTYRTALAAYRQLLESRAQRESRRVPLVSYPPAERAASPVAATAGLDALTPRECEVADLVARGYSNRQIAEALVVSRGTVANHVAHILAKLGVTNRTQIAAWVHEQTMAANQTRVVRRGVPVVPPAPVGLLRPDFASTGTGERAAVARVSGSANSNLQSSAG